MESNSAESNSARSYRCVKSIQNRSGTMANVILLVGRLGAGKSTLTEVITGAEGLSSGGIHSSTDHCQVFDTTINGEEYFIVDTPGFEPGNKGEIFRQITEMLQQLQQNSIFGIWYLINNLTRQDGFDKEMVAWLLAFCGQSFCPNVTIVTTFWTGEGGMLRNQNENLRQRLDEEWAQLQASGAEHHAFGKHYVDGIPQESTISLFDPAKREELEQQARTMVTRYCHSETTSLPQILRELGEPRPLHRTSASRIFPPQKQQVPRGAPHEEGGGPREDPNAAEPRVIRQCDPENQLEEEWAGFLQLEADMKVRSSKNQVLEGACNKAILVHWLRTIRLATIIAPGTPISIHFLHTIQPSSIIDLETLILEKSTITRGV
ncbi:hypothetical protein ASPCAL11622 [Aspergillus calidoustus]|uniref:G domain-containing protein n=1 Tax=Aspergillus calidoustus TaxID=454130 RepID=A0A0U5GCY8_ASPCI|nr:hypothetical protein ASPCAL11622 [Aspergillus calidoustus]